MPQCQQLPSWRLEGGGQIIDLETAVKDGILGGAGGGGVGLDAVAAEKLDLRKMIEDLDVAAAGGTGVGATEDVPTVFICPISLEPMVDPVTLCTGQTYERANIVRWLSLGRRTCPTTMQDLWDDALTPNRTLQQLIHAWFSQCYLRFKKRSEDVQGRAADLIASLRAKVKGQARLQVLKELLCLVAAHPSIKKAVVDAGGVGVLSSLLGPFTSHAVGSEVISILVSLSLDLESKSSLMQPAKMSLIIDVLNEGTVQTKINCAQFIEMLMDDKNFRPELVSSLSLLVGLMRLIKDRRNPNGVSAGLGLLKSICGHEQVRSMVVSIGMVPQLVELLPNLNPECLEPALTILDALSSVPEGLVALKDCSQTIPNAVRLLMRVSEGCTQRALSILWAVCKLAPDECTPVAVEAGMAAKLLLVIQSGCSPDLKQQAAELLKLCSLNYTASLFISKCKLTRTIQ